jgi:hypothetical protein
MAVHPSFTSGSEGAGYSSMSSLLRRCVAVIAFVGFIIGIAVLATWAAAIYRAWPCAVLSDETGIDRRGADPQAARHQQCPSL